MEGFKIRGETLAEYGSRKGIEHPRGKYPFEVVEQVRHLYTEEVPLKTISKVVDVPLETLKDWIYRQKRTQE